MRDSQSTRDFQFKLTKNLNRFMSDYSVSFGLIPNITFVVFLEFYLSTFDFRFHFLLPTYFMMLREYNLELSSFLILSLCE